MWHQKGKRLQKGGRWKQPLRLTMAIVCVSAMAVFSSSGQYHEGAAAAGVLPPEQSGAGTAWGWPPLAGQREIHALALPRQEREANPPEPYDYSRPVPERPPVDGGYFADAAFVGDSRTDGLLIYSGLTGAENLSYKGMTVESAQDKPVRFTGREETCTAMEALAEGSYGKVYVMLGINELGWNGTEDYEAAYDSLLTEIRRLQPDAAVYVQGILPVAPSAQRQKSYFNNQRIAEYNEVALRLAEAHQMYYLNVGECMADENGALPEEAGVDGIHLTRSYYVKWFEYLKSHTVED